MAMPEDAVEHQALGTYQSLSLPIALLALALSFVSLGVEGQPSPRGAEGPQGIPAIPKRTALLVGSIQINLQ
jgi:hypothetical protein